MEFQPKNLTEAIDHIVSNTSIDELDFIIENDENKLMGMYHHGMGTGLRNNWKLWWSPENSYGVSKPAIVEYFNDLGIYHADDMSGIILTSAIRKIKGRGIDLLSQVEEAIKFWKDEGFINGIPNK